MSAPHNPAMLVQDAVVALLEAALGSYHGGDGTLSVFAGRAPSSSLLDYVEYGEGGTASGGPYGLEWSGDDTLHVWARGPGARGVKQLFASVCDALHRVTVTLDDGRKVRGTLSLTTTAADPFDLTGNTMHGVAKYAWRVVG